MLVTDHPEQVENLTKPLGERFSLYGPVSTEQVDPQTQFDTVVLYLGSVADVVALRGAQPSARIVAVTNDPRREAIARSSGADVVIPVGEASIEYLSAMAEPTLTPIVGGDHSQIELTATVTTDETGIITRASPYFAELVAAESSRALIGVQLHSLFARQGHANAVMSRLAPATTLRNVEVELLRADRTRGWVLLTLRKTKDGAKIHGAAVDITDLAQAWQGLARSEARYQSLFDASSIPVWEVDLYTAVGLLEQAQAGRGVVPRLELAALLVGSLRLVHANDYARKCSLTDPGDDPAVLRAMVRMVGGPNGMDILDQVERFAQTSGPLCVPAVGRDTQGNSQRVSVTWNAPMLNGLRDLAHTIVTIAPGDPSP